MIQLALLAAVQEHPVAILMATVPDAPVDPTDTTPGSNDSWQDVGAAGDGSVGCGAGDGVGDGFVGCGSGDGVGDDGVGDDGVGDDGVGTDGVGAPAAWVTVSVWVPILSVAVLVMVDVFAVNAKRIVPLPVPLPAVTISQDAELVADQLHVGSVVTATVPVPATELNEAVIVSRA